MNIQSSTKSPKGRIAAAAIAIIAILGLFITAVMAPGSQLWDLRFNPYAILSATTLVLDTGLLIYFVRKPARTEERIWLAVFLASLIVYAAGEMMWRLSGTPVGAAFWTNVSDVGPMIAGAFYLFTLAYVSRSEKRYTGVTAIIILGTLLLAFFLSYTKLIYNTDPHVMNAIQPWGLDSSIAPGDGSTFDLLWFVGLPIVALVQLINFRRHSRNPILRRQSLIFIFAAAIPIVGGTITDLVLPELGAVTPALGITLFTPAAFLLIYGLVRYQLLTVSPTLFSNTILGIMQESVVVADDKFNVVYLNPKAEAVFGIKSESQDKTSFTKMLEPSSVPTFEQAIAGSAKQDAETIDIEHIDVTRPHAAALPMRAVVSRLHLSDLKMWVLALSDITKELQTRGVIEHEVDVRTQQLNEARAYLVSSINSLEQGFILVNHKGQTELINGVAAHLFGISTADITTSRNLSDIVKTMSWDWDVDLPAVVTKVLDAKHYKQQAAAGTNGSSYELFVTPVLAGEHVLGATIVIQDVTEQKILDRSKDEFFSIASHELRTPLTAIRGNMSMVKDYFPDAMKDESLANMVTDTHDASVRLIAIVNDFLDSSKLEQGKMQFNVQPTVLAPIVEAVQKDLTVLLETKHNTLSAEGLHKLPKVLVDEGRVRQIIYNLLSNAIKYSENARITVSGEVHGDKLHLEFSDTGKGISPENQKLLFHKFQQASDPLTRDDTKGTGLGLYISQLLAKNMHGDVQLKRSEVGKGSTFVLILPIAK